MDNAHTLTAQELDYVEDSGINETSSALNRLFLSVASYLRPFTPQIIPVLVCFSFIPLAIILSLAAGLLVWRSAAVSWEAPLYLQYGDGTPPYAVTPLPSLVSGQSYGISVQLILPSTESNFALGNFMTTLTLATPSNQTLTSVRRPTIVFPPRAHLFNHRRSTITMNVLMLSSFILNSQKINAHVQIGRNDGWKSLGSGEGKEIAIVSAMLQGTVTHSGIRGLVSRFPLIFSALSTMVFFMIFALILSACMLPTVLRHTPQDKIKEEPENGFSISPSRSLTSSDGDETVLRRFRSKPRRDRNKRIRPMTSRLSHPEPKLLRRRRSRASGVLSD